MTIKEIHQWNTVYRSSNIVKINQFAINIATKYCKGLILYSAQGCGKTTFARLILQSLIRNVGALTLSVGNVAAVINNGYTFCMLDGVLSSSSEIEHLANYVESVVTDRGKIIVCSQEPIKIRGFLTIDLSLHSEIIITNFRRQFDS